MTRVNERQVKNNTYKCSGCRKFLLKEFFYKSKKEKFGISNCCKKCQFKRTHTKEALAKRKKYLKKYKEQNADYLIDYRRYWRAERKRKVFEKFGSKCGKCGFTDIRALQIDHVNGEGYKEKNKSDTYYVKVLNDITGSYQLLCANCNWIKRYEKQEYKYWGRDPILPKRPSERFNFKKMG